MIDTKDDEIFCGVRRRIIETAKPLINKEVIHQWYFHQRERTDIYYKKEIQQLLPPWTDDKILSTYKFVNTKRTWDRQTKWLLSNVINNEHLSYDNKLLNCVLFRVINKGETFDLFGGAIDFSDIDLNYINNSIRDILDEKTKADNNYVFFNAAYILGGPKVNFGKSIEQVEQKNEPNMIIRMLKFVYYNQDEILKGITSSKTQMDVYDNLRIFKGIGKFLSYQMFIDMTYIQEFPFTEHNFVIAGPGCERGINWIFDDKAGMTDEECLFWFTKNQFDIAETYSEDWNMDALFHFLDKKDRVYTLMDMENSGACEIDKRCRTLFNGKRPKQKYKY